MVKLKLLFILIIFSFLNLRPAICQEIYSLEYRIGPQDELEIQVFGMEELSNIRVRVKEDGSISLPQLGEVSTDGMTSSALEEKLKRLLVEKGFLQNPQVTVFITAHLSKRIYVIGAVATQGYFELIGRQRILHFIAEAGGITEQAGIYMYVIREFENGNFNSQRIPITELFENVNMDFNIPLEPNDIIHVPVDRLVPIYVGGQVGSPGVLEVRKSNIPTLSQAIIQAGGFAEKSKKNSVLLRRMGSDGKVTTKEYPVKDIIEGKAEDVQLQAGDMIYVPQSVW